MRRLAYWVLAPVALYGMSIVLPCIYPYGPLNSVNTHLPETIFSVYAEDHAEGASVNKLKVTPRHKAVRLTWNTNITEKGPMTFKIFRSMLRPDGEYTLVASIKWRPEVKRYKYIDKTTPVEENYFYKIEIPETKETFGPLQVRPAFSLPST